MADFARKAVALHNNYRSQHDAPPLEWSQALADLAKDYAKTLVSRNPDEPLAPKKGVNLGQNIFELKRTGGETEVLDDNIALERAVESWYQDGANYEPESSGSGKKGGRSFSQLLWKSTERVGVGIASTKGADSLLMIVIAFYDPPGNYRGEFEENVRVQKSTSATQSASTNQSQSLSNTRDTSNSSLSTQDASKNSSALVQSHKLTSQDSTESSSSVQSKSVKMESRQTSSNVKISEVRQQSLESRQSFDSVESSDQQNTSNMSNMLSQMGLDNQLSQLKKETKSSLLQQQHKQQSVEKVSNSETTGSSISTMDVRQSKEVKSSQNFTSVSTSSSMRKVTMAVYKNCSIMGHEDLERTNKFDKQIQNTQNLAIEDKFNQMLKGTGEDLMKSMGLDNRILSQQQQIDKMVKQASKDLNVMKKGSSQEEEEEEETTVSSKVVKQSKTVMKKTVQSSTVKTTEEYEVESEPEEQVQQVQKSLTQASQKVVQNVQQQQPVPQPPKPVAPAPPPSSVQTNVTETTVTSKKVVMTETLRVAVQMHNELRKRHGASEVTIDEKLCEEAKTYCRSMVTKTERKESSVHYGRNVYQMTSSSPLDPAEVMKKAIEKWYSSVDQYNFADPLSSGQGSRAFTQLIWKSSTTIGVSVETHAQTTAVVVLYNPPGNVTASGTDQRWKENVLPASS